MCVVSMFGTVLVHFVFDINFAQILEIQDFQKKHY